MFCRDSLVSYFCIGEIFYIFFEDLQKVGFRVFEFLISIVEISFLWECFSVSS